MLISSVDSIENTILSLVDIRYIWKNTVIFEKVVKGDFFPLKKRVTKTFLYRLEYHNLISVVLEKNVSKYIQLLIYSSRNDVND